MTWDKGHFGSKFLHLKGTDGPHLSREQTFGPLGPSIGSLGA